ncbi:MAG: ferredoxin family protein, partial [Betaproteobacteria bacterium AqS2]|nr:ferredoxin family protein [Betaproteobacteria bacterium AqS2]
NMLVINPEECIDCALCVPECPVDAIYHEDDVPAEQKPYFAINEKFAKVWPVLLAQKPAPPDADDWANKPDKTKLIEE